MVDGAQMIEIVGGESLSNGGGESVGSAVAGIMDIGGGNFVTKETMKSKAAECGCTGSCDNKDGRQHSWLWELYYGGGDSDRVVEGVEVALVVDHAVAMAIKI